MNETAEAAMDADVMTSAAPSLQPHPLLPNLFASNSFTAQRQQMESSQLFRYQELTGHTEYIRAIEFSDDGTHLVSGGRDNTVRLWSHDEGRDEWNSIEMETKHEDNVTCLAISPDNRRIFSGGLDKKVLIHDTTT